MPAKQEIAVLSTVAEAEIEANDGSIDSCLNASVHDGQVRGAAQVISRVRWSALWVVVGRGTGLVATLLCNVLVARLLAPEDFGRFVLITSMIAFASGFATLGLNVAIVRVVAESLGKFDPGRAQSALRMSFAIAAVATGVVGLATAIFFYTTGARLFALPDPQYLVPMMVTGLALLAFLQLTAESLRSLHEFRLASMISGGQSGGPLCNVIFLTMLGTVALTNQPSLLLTIGLNLLAMKLILPPALLCLYRQARKRFALVGKPDATAHGQLTVGGLLTICIPMMLTQVLAFVTTQADLWIAGANCPDDQLALFSAARRLMLMVGIPLQMANLTVISTIPELSAQGRLSELQRLLRGTASLAAVPSTLALLFIVLQPNLILGLLFGEFYAAAAIPAAILGVAQLCVCWTGTAGLTLTMARHERTALAVNVGTSLALFALGWPAAKWFGIQGVAVVSGGIVAAQSLILWWLCRRLVGVRTDVAFSDWFSGLRWVMNRVRS